MTERQKRFCAEYLIDLNATQAAIRAGYSVKNADKIGSELLGKTRVWETISEQLERIHNENTADAQEVMEYLTSVMRGKARSYVLAFIDGAQIVIEKPPDEKEKLKAAELLGKRYGLFTDKVEMDTELHITIDYGKGLESEDGRDDDERETCDADSGRPYGSSFPTLAAGGAVCKEECEPVELCVERSRNLI